MKSIKVSPSDFAWLYDTCPRCWWLKVNHGFKSDSRPPAVFNLIDRAMKDGITVENLNLAGIPAKAIISGEWVKSKPFEHDGVSLVINGKRDLAFEMEDGSVGIIDYKTTQPKPDSVKKYARQLHGYLHAMEYPDSGTAREVGYLGLYCFNPFGGYFKVQGDQAALKGSVCSVPIPIDRGSFQKFLEKLCETASGPIPDESGACETCNSLSAVIEKIIPLQQAQAGTLDTNVSEAGMQPGLTEVPA